MVHSKLAFASPALGCDGGGNDDSNNKGSVLLAPIRL